MPICTKCKEDVPFEGFRSRKDRPLGRRSDCIKCEDALRAAHYKTVDGVVTTIWSTQRRASRKRGYDLPNYSKKELKEWLVTRDNWEELYSGWLASDCDRLTKPSTDRLDDYKPYTIDNIRLVAFRDNLEAYYKNVYSGTTTKALEGVKKLDKSTGEELGNYFSIAEANRVHEKAQNNSDIVAVLNGRQKTCWGFKWERV